MSSKKSIDPTNLPVTKEFFDSLIERLEDNETASAKDCRQLEELRDSLFPKAKRGGKVMLELVLAIIITVGLIAIGLEILASL